MSTRGCVAVGVPLKWHGVYNHYDSYPAGLGKELWRFVAGPKNPENLGMVCDEILKAGRWEIFLGKRDRGEQDLITSENPDPLFIEWVYVIDPERNMLHVLANESAGQDDWTRPAIRPPVTTGRITDYGRFAYKHVLVSSVDLAGPEPDWAAMGRRGRPEDEE